MPGDTAPTQAKRAVLAMALGQESAIAQDLKRAIANLETWKAFKLANASAGSMPMTPQSLTVTVQRSLRNTWQRSPNAVKSARGSADSLFMPQRGDRIQTRRFYSRP